jgi:hypothetical protein
LAITAWRTLWLHWTESHLKTGPCVPSLIYFQCPRTHMEMTLQS